MAAVDTEGAYGSVGKVSCTSAGRPGTRLKKPSTTPTWTSKPVPAVWAIGVPPLPVGEPWLKVSPGKTATRREGVPARTVIAVELSLDTVGRDRSSTISARRMVEPARLSVTV